MLRRLFTTRFALSRPATIRRSPVPGRFRLAVEHLEEREVPSVTLASFADSQASASQVDMPSNKPIFIPVTVTNTPNGTVTTTVSSDNAGVTASVLQGGQSVRFDVSGTDANGNPFTGSITVRLFTDEAPVATQRIIDLVNSGYYNGKTFHRVADLFASSGGSGQSNVIVQGGSSDGAGAAGSNLPNFADEFNPDFTFDSNGLVAMANSGDDTNNAQFFFTDIQKPLASQVSFLNFNYTIFGIITSGFDTLKKMQGTPLNSGSTVPSHPMTITGATVFTDTQNAVVEIKPNGPFTGTANITVTATDNDGPTTENFAVQGVNDGVNSRAFISGPIANPTTTAGTPITFTVPVTDIDGDQMTLDVRDANFSGAPANFTFTIDQTNHTVTITPNAGFTGTVQFKVGVRDQTDRSGSGLSTASNYDTQLLTLTVNPAATPNPGNGSSTGTLTATGSAPGAAPAVTVLNADGSLRFTVPVFSPSFTGGVKAAVGDVDGDGKPDIVVVPGVGGGGLVWILDSTTGAFVRQIRVFEPSFRGGLNLKLADVNNLGYDQVLVGAGDSGGPRVTLLDLKLNKQLLNFFAGDPNTRGGVDVDVGEIFQGKGQLIVAGSGPGQNPLVSLFRVSDTTFFGSFTPTGAGDAMTGIHVRVSAPDATTGPTVRPIFVSPLHAPFGTQEQEFDPSKFVDPNGAPKPAATTASGLPPGLDLSSLMPKS